MALSGRCLCGAVRYKTDANPAFVGNCYCGTCRRETGAGHITIVAVPSDRLTVTGALRVLHIPRADDAPPIPRHQCAACGTTLFARPLAMEGMSMLRAGTLDDGTPLKVELSVFVDQAQPWDRPSADVPVMTDAPTRN
jgi:hypothetical protein